VAPEVVRPVVAVSEREEEVLQLREAQQCRSLDDVDTEGLEGRVVEVERVLQRQLAAGVGLLDARILDDIYLIGWPARRDVTSHGLKKQRPGARESDEQWRRNGEIILLVQALSRNIPLRDRRRLRCCQQREVVFDGRRFIFRDRLVQRVLLRLGASLRDIVSGLIELEEPRRIAAHDGSQEE